MIRLPDVHFFEEWSSISPKRGWYTFHPISLGFENEKNLGCIIIVAALLGLGVRITLVYAETEMVRAMKRELDKRTKTLTDHN